MDFWSSFPVVTCPHCEKEFQVDDYYDLKSGDSFDCNHCEKEIHIRQVDIIMECQLSTRPAT
jgi:hypothetical protein